MDAINSNLLPDQEVHDRLLHLMQHINALCFRLFGNKVCLGPFTGMEIPEQCEDGNSGTKLLGTYETYLTDALQYAQWRLPNAVVNVGCGDGFYAIGMAIKLPEKQIYAFDLSEAALELCNEYAERNVVADRVHTQRGCDHASELQLPDVLGHRLYIFDCEGCELSLVDLEACPQLRNSDLIIECHDFLHSHISSVIADRLAATHRVELIEPTLPNLESYHFIKVFPTIMSVLMAVEKRPMPCRWLACWANQKGSH